MSTTIDMTCFQQLSEWMRAHHIRRLRIDEIEIEIDAAEIKTDMTAQATCSIDGEVVGVLPASSV